MNKIILITISLLVAVGLTISGCSKKKEDSSKPAPSGIGDAAKQAESTEPPTQALIKAADFMLSDLNGKEVRLSDYIGKVVILDFWATWCPPCVKEIPHFNALAKEYQSKGLVVIGVSVDQGGMKAVKKFIQRTPIDYTVVQSVQTTHTQYQSYLPPEMQGGIPFTFVIDKQGDIREHYVGYRPKEVFVSAITPLL